MHDLVARQPIFDSSQGILGYFLLVHPGAKWHTGSNAPGSVEPAPADPLATLNPAAYTFNTTSFVPVTQEMLGGLLHSQPAASSVALVLAASVEPLPEVVQAVSALKKAGFEIALDHFEYNIRYEPLIQHANVIMVDFDSCEEDDRAFLVKRYASQGVRTLAKNINDWKAFNEAREIGYDYFHGPFYKVPTIIGSQDVPSYKTQCLKLISEINRLKVDNDRVEDIIKKDVTLTFKLLRYINSAHFGRRERINSVRHSLMLMGQKETKKWASMVAFKQMADDRPGELFVSALIRARFCESLASVAGMPDRDQELFLMGMFSYMDAILGRPIKSIVGTLPIADDIKQALCGEENQAWSVLQCVRSHEEAHWESLAELTGQLGLSDDDLTELYLGALEWACGSDDGETKAA